MAEKRRASGQRGCFGGQKTTPKGSVIREGVRGEREVEKRLEFTPGRVHLAEHETCDQEDCSSSKRCKQCAKFTKKNIQNARAKSLPGMDEKERQEKNRKRREEYNRMGEKERQEKNKKRRKEYGEKGHQEENKKRREEYKPERQEKNKKRREKYKPYVPIKLKADKGMRPRRLQQQ